MTKTASFTDFVTGRANQDATLEILHNRIDWLRTPQRRLVYLYYVQGLSFHQLSGLTGQNEFTLTKRVRNIARRLVHSPYVTVKRHPDIFDSRETLVAYDKYLLGSGYRAIARRYDLSEYRTRKILTTIKRKIDMLQTAGCRLMNGSGNI